MRRRPPGQPATAVLAGVAVIGAAASILHVTSGGSPSYRPAPPDSTIRPDHRYQAGETAPIGVAKLTGPRRLLATVTLFTCEPLAQLTVTETPDTVTVTARAGRTNCRSEDFAQYWTPVKLHTDLGHRRLVDAATGAPIEITRN